MNTTLLFSAPSGGEWIIVLIVVIVLFGGKKIPELMRGMGKGVKEFNDAKGEPVKKKEELDSNTTANS